MLPKIIQLAPQYRDYVWGGHRLRPGPDPTAEAWIVYEGDQVAAGSMRGRTLADLAAEFPVELAGRRLPGRFPLLIKLLDCAEWLSVQVHPDDDQARRMEGPDQNGKTEAWHILDAEPDARLIAGLKPGVDHLAMEVAIRQGRIVDLARYLDVRTGETVYMPARTNHALGPGLLIYEIQETSDITYRVYDWDRPQSEGRQLHIEQSIAVANPSTYVEPVPDPPLDDGESKVVCRSDYFILEKLYTASQEIHFHTYGKTFHTLTVIDGRVRLFAGDENLTLNRYETALIPASGGDYFLQPERPSFLLKATLP